MSDMKFLIAEVTYSFSDTKITFSQGDATKSHLSSSQSLIPGLLIEGCHGSLLTGPKELTDIVYMVPVAFSNDAHVKVYRGKNIFCPT